MPKILLVEDEENIRKTLGYRLANSGYCVLAVECPKKALEEIAKQTIDLIISDTFSIGAVEGPGGFDFCRNIKSNPAYKGIPFIFLTAAGQKQHREQGLAAGADLYVIKPFDSQELVENIRELLDKG